MIIREKKTFMNQNAAITEYIRSLYATEDDALIAAKEAPAHHGIPAIQIQAHEGKMLQFLARSVGARKAVEIGALAGYSGIWLARALPEDGKLISLEVSPKHAEAVRESFARAGLNGRAEVRVGNAHDMLEALREEGPFDFCFIDAEKTGYPQYLKWALDNVRPGGMVVGHNALQQGRILSPTYGGDDAMREFNRILAEDPRVTGMLIPIGDGMAAGIIKG